MTGLFITFEGPDGSGKSTQARLLADRLRSAGYDTRLTREPGGAPLGEVTRALLLHPDETLAALRQAGLVAQGEPADHLLPISEAMLFSAARAQHVARIREWLSAGVVTLCDRYADATLAYQGFGRGYDLGMLRTLQAMATGGLQPILTLLFDLSVEEGLLRKQAAAATGDELNRMDVEDRAFHERVRQGYLTLAAAEPARWVTLEASLPVEALAEQVWVAVSTRLQL